MKKYFRFTTIALLLLFSFAVKAVPKLSSYPSAEATIFLDFDGHNVISGVWNNGSPLDCGSAVLSETQITEIFNRVAEDFRPFDLNVTTDSSIFIAAPLDKRIRIIVTPTSYWYPGVGGVAWITSFTWGDDTPAFVFSDRFSSAKAIAECCSHEAGHTLGLSHQSKYDVIDCFNPFEHYNSGQGDGPTGWAPLMGNSYGRNMTNWNNGPTPYGCNNVQDNLTIITSFNGFGYKADDYADSATINTASLISSNFSVNGIINKSTDKDAFKLIVANSSVYHFTALPYSIADNNEGANLDIKMDIYDASGVLIKSCNPLERMDLLIDTVLNPGTYYFVLDGTGNVNTSEYGSMGSYTFTGTSSALPIKQVGLSGNILNGKHNLNWNIVSDDLVQKLIIESSTDIVNFYKAEELDASITSTSFISNKQVVYYRLKVISVTGQIMYSNIVALKEKAGVNTIFSVSTLIQSQITINASQPYQFQLYNSKGVLIRTGAAATGLNSIDMQNNPDGLYIIRLTGENITKTERIIKQ